jgi:hypothetical protein
MYRSRFGERCYKTDVDLEDAVPGTVLDLEDAVPGTEVDLENAVRPCTEVTNESAGPVK